MTAISKRFALVSSVVLMSAIMTSCSRRESVEFAGCTWILPDDHVVAGEYDDATFHVWGPESSDGANRSYFIYFGLYDEKDGDGELKFDTDDWKAPPFAKNVRKQEFEDCIVISYNEGDPADGKYYGEEVQIFVSKSTMRSVVFQAMGYKSVLDSC